MQTEPKLWDFSAENPRFNKRLNFDGIKTPENFNRSSCDALAFLSSNSINEENYIIQKGKK